MPKKDIMVIGASAGGIEALRALVGGLPKEFAASLFVVLHTAPQSPGILDQILARAGALPAKNAFDKEQIQLGRIYVAPPDHHLLIEPGIVRVTKGPKENRFRPAVDPLFRSAAQTYGPRVVGVILTGGLDDGTAGLWAIKQLGGTSIVQDPEQALSPSMPMSALRHVKVDYILPIEEVAPLLVRLSNTPAEEEGAEDQMSNEMEIEIKIAKEAEAIEAGIRTIGNPSSYACPECHGVLLQLKEGDRIRFRCHTGHAYSTDSLLAEITERIDESLWNSIRSIEESVMLLRHLARHARENNGGNAEQFEQKAEEAQRRSDLVRQAVMNHENLSEVKLTQDMMKS